VTGAFGLRVMMPRSVGVWLLASTLLVAVGPAVQAQQDTVLAEAAVELAFLNGPAEIVPALVYNGTMLLPMHRFFVMAEIRVTAFALRDSLVAVLEPLGQTVHLHPDRGELVLGDTIVALASYDAVWWDGDLFARPEIFERVLGVVVDLDWITLSARVGRTAGLPIVRRARRERQRAWITRAGKPVPLVLSPRRPTAGGAVLNWSLTGSTGVSDYYTLDLGLGAQLVGGNLTVRPGFWNVGNRNGSELRASWERAWPQREWVRQVRVGDVQSNGRRAQLMRGAVVTNAPFVRSSEFDVEQIVGSLPPGWEVELYDRGRLLGYGTVDAVGAFQLPLEVRYGQNPFELVMYGPTGEVMRQKRTIRVPFSRLPQGRFEYAAALGQCRYEPCDGMLSADTRYGLSSWMTLQGGTDVFAKDGGGTLWQPYAVASAAITRSVSVTGEAVVNGHLRGSANYEPSPDLRITLAHTDFAEAGRAFSGSFVENHRTEVSGFWRPGPMRGTLYFQAFAVRSAQATATRTIARVSATTQVGMLRYTAGVRHDGTSQLNLPTLNRVAFDASADAILPWRNRWLRGTNVRGEVSVDPSAGLAAVAATAGRLIERSVRADVGIGWFRGGGWGFTLAFTTALSGPRFGIRSQSNTLAGTSGLAFVNGSAVYDTRQGTVQWTDGADLGRAGISGILYLDENGNGVRDEGERGLPNIPVQVGGRGTQTDALGQFTVWDLLPFEAVDIVADSLAFDDPRMIPGAPLLQVRPAPNSFVTVDVPVVVGAEVSGYVLLDGVGLAGIPIVLRELTTGAEFFSVTYTDGIFYRAGVPPGEYEVTIRDTDMERLGVFVMPLHLFIPPGVGEKRYDDLAIVLERLDG